LDVELLFDARFYSRLSPCSCHSRTEHRLRVTQRDCRCRSFRGLTLTTWPPSPKRQSVIGRASGPITYTVGTRFWYHARPWVAFLLFTRECHSNARPISVPPPVGDRLGTRRVGSSSRTKAVFYRVDLSSATDLRTLAEHPMCETSTHEDMVSGSSRSITPWRRTFVVGGKPCVGVGPGRC